MQDVVAGIHADQVLDRLLAALGVHPDALALRRAEGADQPQIARAQGAKLRQRLNGVGALDNLSGTNYYNSPITLETDAAVGSDAGSLVIQLPIAEKTALTKLTKVTTSQLCLHLYDLQTPQLPARTCPVRQQPLPLHNHFDVPAEVFAEPVGADCGLDFRSSRNRP